MIKTEKEYQDALRRMDEDKAVVAKQREALKKQKFTAVQIEKALEAIFTFHEQLAEEVQWYERVKRGNLGTLSSLASIGRYLVALRIRAGITQKELADKLKVAESQVSRDERNEYHGISVERAQKIMDLLHAKIQATVDIEEQYRRPVAAA